MFILTLLIHKFAARVSMLSFFIVFHLPLTDSSIIASRLVLNLDDLLWVLTDTQMKAAVLFANSLKEIIKKSSEQSKLRAGEKIEVRIGIVD